MTSINERMYVNCPFGKAPSYLSRSLHELVEGSGGDRAILHLQVPLTELGIPADVAHDVVARFEPPTDASFGHVRTAVRWTPDGGGPFPDFDGSITVEEDERYGSCALVLQGRYEPPLGTFGKAFDAAMGRRIARRTARELLDSLRRRIEKDWGDAGKAGVRTNAKGGLEEHAAF